MRGTVARLMPERGFGVIEAETGEEFFFNINALNGTEWGELAPASAVEFEAEGREPGDRPDEQRRAGNVHLAPGAVPAVDNEPLPPEKVNR